MYKYVVNDLDVSQDAPTIIIQSYLYVLEFIDHCIRALKSTIRALNGTVSIAPEDLENS